MALYTVVASFEVADSGRSPADTHRRALDAAEVALSFLGRAKHVAKIEDAALTQDSGLPEWVYESSNTHSKEAAWLVGVGDLILVFDGVKLVRVKDGNDG